MLSLSFFFKSKEIWSIWYGSMGCDDKDEWSFGGPEDEWSVWIPDILWWGFGFSIDSPLKITRRFTEI